MRFLTLTLLVLATAVTASAQDYPSLRKQAWDAYEAKEYLQSAQLYNRAFRENGDIGGTIDRYNAACSWALTGQLDSAFHQLLRIAEKGNYSEYDHLSSDSDLETLYVDPRWENITTLVAENKKITEKDYDQELIAVLDNVFSSDQDGRNTIRETESKYGRNSDEMKILWQEINYRDSTNLIVVKEILDERGWLGSNVIGRKGNSTLFLVIQHSNLEDQQEYLPMMREAVKDGRAKGSSLALLEDRVALRTGNPQIYGSQVRRTKEGTHYVQELIDPETVDERRASVGLPPLGDYTQHWDFDWDIERHKRIVAEVKAEKE